MISLLHPSRGRPEKAFYTMTDWMLSLPGSRVEYILSVDEDDPCLNTYIRLFEGQRVLVNKNTSVVEATNVAARCSTGNILVYLSDDFKCPDGWGALIEKEFEGVTTPMLLKVDDCLQKFSAPVLTIPIMNRALYEKLGYFWNPLYKSMWTDCDLYETVKRMGALHFAAHLRFPHEHHSNGKTENDETYRRSEANWNQGLAVFNKRKRAGFPV